MELKEKTILITGASSGIGRATSVLCSELGARVVITGRDEGRLNETYVMLSGEGHIKVVQDLLCKEGLDSFFSKIVTQVGKLHGLVHCAGIAGVIPLKALSRGQLEKIMETNFYSFVEVVRQFGKKKYSMNKASIVGISSRAATAPRAYEMAYIASKAALEAAIPVIALELKSRQIRVNSVSPGVVKTGMTMRAIGELNNSEGLKDIKERSIQGWQSAEQIAKICAFLLSDDSVAITAKNIQADGGFI